ncbi:MAG: hypothetical protein ACREQR_09155 [Candidatus Binataceae bacterium]
MKRLFTITAAALFALAAAGLAFAQNYDADFQHFLNKHPNEAAQLRANPKLIDNPTWVHNHGAMAQYLDNHPNVRRSIRGQVNGGRGYGDWDEHHVWRDPDWWQQNNPTWWRQHHPEWAESHPHWYNDGDWDDHHVWRDSSWWHQNHPNQWAQWHHGPVVAHPEGMHGPEEPHPGAQHGQEMGHPGAMHNDHNGHNDMHGTDHDHDHH